QAEAACWSPSRQPRSQTPRGTKACVTSSTSLLVHGGRAGPLFVVFLFRKITRRSHGRHHDVAPVHHDRRARQKKLLSLAQEGRERTQKKRDRQIERAEPRRPQH